MTTTETVRLKVADGTEMQAFVARPEGGRRPALLVLQEAFGVDGHIKDVAERFAREGFVVIAPELFHRTAGPGETFGHDEFPKIMPHMQAATVERMTADFQAVHGFLTADKQVDP